MADPTRQDDPKVALRAALRAQRAAHTPHATTGATLAALLDTHPAWREARVVAGFMAVRGEIAVTEPLARAQARGVTLVLPRVTGSVLTFHVWSGEPLVPGSFGIPEPTLALPMIDPSAIDVLLVPGVAFTSAGARLGQGGGFYDRVLAGPRGRAIGVAWSFQVVETVPLDPWDQGVDGLVTEGGWVFG
ncbi:MAG: 5-formyltetrahydrofolate cyclo-ligase [Pseudomonadota bacterium]|nr:5-formyltetrahydrofolate cyclo-ligase [Pseudomonadota bacterium]